MKVKKQFYNSLLLRYDINKSFQLMQEKNRELLDFSVGYTLNKEKSLIKKVYNCLRSFDKYKLGYSFPCVKTISTSLSISERHCFRCINHLIEINLIQRLKWDGRHSYYVFLVPFLKKCHTINNKYYNKENVPVFANKKQKNGGVSRLVKGNTEMNESNFNCCEPAKASPLKKKGIDWDKLIKIPDVINGKSEKTDPYLYNIEKELYIHYTKLAFYKKWREKRKMKQIIDKKEK